MASSSAARPARRGDWVILGFLALAVLVVLAVIVLLARVGQTSAEPYSVNSPQPRGLLGLRLWLEEMGYRVEVGDSPELASDADVIFLFPGAGIEPEQIRDVVQNVDDGCTLVVAGTDSPQLRTAFGALVQLSQPFAGEKLLPTQPILARSGVSPEVLLAGSSLMIMPGSYSVPVLVTEDGRVAAFVERRKLGVAWRVGIDGAFTNADLRDGWSRALTLAVLRKAGAGGLVYIVNGENGVPSVSSRRPADPVDGLWAWLLSTPVGWSVLALAALALFYLFTEGRGLGPPLPLGDPRRRRAAVEHIRAMANLAQRAGHRQGVAQYQKTRLKRRIGGSWRVGANLPDASFVAALAEQNALPAGELAALSDLLGQFDRVVDEAALVRTVDAADRFAMES